MLQYKDQFFIDSEIVLIFFLLSDTIFIILLSLKNFHGMFCSINYYLSTYVKVKKVDFIVH